MACTLAITLASETPREYKYLMVADRGNVSPYFVVVVVQIP